MCFSRGQVGQRLEFCRLHIEFDETQECQAISIGWIKTSASFPVMVSCFVWPGIDEWVVGSESLPEVKLSWQFPSSFSLNYM